MRRDKEKEEQLDARRGQQQAPEQAPDAAMPLGQRIRLVRVDADALGRWAYHCHLLYHMEAGMFREVVVS